MSAKPYKASVLAGYQGEQGLLYSETDNYTLDLPRKDVDESIDSAIFTPEIYGMGIMGIIALVAIVVSLALGYTMLAPLFAVPLIGIVIGFSYIRYVKTHGKS